MSATWSRRLLLTGIGGVVLAGATLATEPTLETTVTYPYQQGTMGGLLLRPALSDGTGVLLVHGEVNRAAVKALAERLVQLGYVVLMPELAPRTAAPFAPLAVALVDQLDASFSFLEQQLKGGDVRPRVALLGLGAGAGEWAFGYALENEDLQGAINCYGRPETHLERVGQLTVPLLGLFGRETDPATLTKALTAAEKPFEFKVLTGPQESIPQDGEAWTQIRTFLEKVLAPT
ncbi:dienelactone hydrolase family protein [Candidatus Cyanaurora vandensis]|uniref:dienelactone hydrolase family protein n=1 Tax=Candidatus Cyanaurora vandensis TaxID=2714958 RepID=UPI00257FF00C|nr:dienelactone hydrolase family protein [Candidatus Cyanaurora vandensis]